MKKFKSHYELEMERLTKEGKVRTLTLEETERFFKQLSAGLDEFHAMRSMRNKIASESHRNFSFS